MAVSPRKITKLRKRTRLSESNVIPKAKKLCQQMKSLIIKCKKCDSLIMRNFTCSKCLNIILNLYPNKQKAQQAKKTKTKE